MSERMNGYGTEREHRPSSEQMADLHVYLVPPDIWREKFNNALNQNINDTISIGFIRVHPETKVYALREEIEQQLGADLIPREYVFLKSVGRSLTRMEKTVFKVNKPSTLIRKEKKSSPATFSKSSLDKFVEVYAPTVLKTEGTLKSRQEATLKVKNFLPPQAYAPEVYLLEATPEVRQAIAASSEGSTRPQSRTSYDYEYMAKSADNAKYSNMPNGAGYQSYYPTLPQITSHTPRPEQQQPASLHPHLQQTSPTRRQQSPPIVIETSASPRGTLTQHDNRVNQNDYNKSENLLSANWTEESEKYNKKSDNYQSNDQSRPFNINRPPKDLRISQPSSDPSLDHPQHPLVSSPRRQEKGTAHDEYLPPLSATPPHSGNEKHKPAGRHGNHGHHGNQHKHDEDSGIAGFTPDTYRENDNNVLDRRKVDSENDRLKPPSPEQDDSDRMERYGRDQDQSDWERQRREEQERQKREEEERRRQEEEEQRRRDEDREKIAEEAKLMKTNSDEDLTRYPSPPPLRLASPERDTASARARRKKQKEELIKELEEAREARKNAERQREELVKNAKQMQNKTQNRRNHARDLWKKRYFEEKKKTTPLEEQCNRLRHELDIIHKRLLTTLEGPKEKATKLSDMKPNSKNNFKVQATRLQHEIEDIRRRVDHAKMKLTSEMKLRNQAETELRALRAELTQKKINLTLSRNSHLTTYAPPASDINFMNGLTARSAITPRS